MILVEEQLNDYNKKINTIQKQLLYMKYDILFEYEPLESITDIINNKMEPLEKKLNTLMKTRTKFNDKYLQDRTVKKDEIITYKEEEEEKEDKKEDEDKKDIVKNLKNLDSNNYDLKEQKKNYSKELIKMQKEKLDEKHSMSNLNNIIEIPANMNNEEPHELKGIINLNKKSNSNSSSNSNSNSSSNSSSSSSSSSNSNSNSNSNENEI